MSRDKGFTLLEVLVAISIFAVVGLGANQMLRTVIVTHDRTSAKVESMSALTRAFATLERDIGQTVPRFIRDEFGDPLPPLMVSTGPYLLELTRSGWSNPINLPRSNLQRVSYDVNEDGELIRRFWLVMDRAEDSEPIEQTILTNVEDFRVRLLADTGDTTDQWPDSNFDVLLPLSVEVILETKVSGELRKVYNLVDLVRTANQDGGNAGEQDSEQDSINTDGSSDDSVGVEQTDLLNEDGSDP